MESQAVKIARMEEKIDNISENVIELKDTLKDHVMSEGVKFDKLDKKYSSKWVERVVLGILMIMIGGFLTAVFNIITK